ncbi:hypothetical protein [Marinomonas mediterranea]|uniref:hypothetical protein n=1 Tax=Marinomonas mediterranea TaxID=119864 RepID=UPI0002FC4A1F|nr:hypothetical protein [Marinomonas mediterranea]WCN09328.1 hypothetical protein GV055_10495 [Marinomonas mediterranea]WCN13406.1 hypothetical protein GV054_10485 [Marinomonas mediterranea]WCN17473.1 hypothetical protein GV053_10610 [Marinomonas mediterranea MMB-1]
MIREFAIFSLVPDVVLVPGDINNNGTGGVFSVGSPSYPVVTLATQSTITLAGATDHECIYALDALASNELKVSERLKIITDFCKAKINAESAIDALLEAGERPKLAFVSPLPPEKVALYFIARS